MANQVYKEICWRHSGLNLVKQVTIGICWRQSGYILVKQVYKGFLSRQSGLNLLKQVNKGIKEYKIKWFVRTFNPIYGFWIAHTGEST